MIKRFISGLLWIGIPICITILLIFILNKISVKTAIEFNIETKKLRFTTVEGDSTILLNEGMIFSSLTFSNLEHLKLNVEKISILDYGEKKTQTWNDLQIDELELFGQSQKLNPNAIIWPTDAALNSLGSLGELRVAGKANVDLTFSDNAPPSLLIKVFGKQCDIQAEISKEFFMQSDYLSNDQVSILSQIEDSTQFKIKTSITRPIIDFSSYSNRTTIVISKPQKNRKSLELLDIPIKNINFTQVDGSGKVSSAILSNSSFNYLSYPNIKSIGLKQGQMLSINKSSNLRIKKLVIDWENMHFNVGLTGMITDGKYGVALAPQQLELSALDVLKNNPLILLIGGLLGFFSAVYFKIYQFFNASND